MVRCSFMNTCSTPFNFLLQISLSPLIFLIHQQFLNMKFPVLYNLSEFLHYMVFFLFLFAEEKKSI